MHTFISILPFVFNKKNKKMIGKIKQFLRQRPRLYYVVFMLTVFVYRQLVFWPKYWLRCFGYMGKYDYLKLKAYKGKHTGERCFIVGTGPSLKMEDLELIKDEISFSVNSIVLSYPDTSYRPTYYVIQDSFGYAKLKDAIRAAKMPVIFNGISNKTLTPKMDVDYIPYPFNLMDQGKMIPKDITKFSNNAFKVVYGGHSVTYSVMQLAAYMGFKEMILLGIDCDYSKPINHIKAYSAQNDSNAAYLMRESYKVARKYADSHGFKILNATRNAKLDVFERVSLENILNH